MWGPLDFVVLALATWRLTHLVQTERGPFRVLQRFRERFAGISHCEQGEPLAWPDTERGILLRCHYCGSLWVGAGLVGLYLWAPYLAIALSLPLALSAAAIVVEEVTGG